MPSFEPVIAVARALELLATLNRLRKASIGDLHRETGLHKSTILRMLETLIHEGFVVRLSTETQYTVTGKCLLLSSGFEAHAALTRIAEPFLAQFRRAVGWPSDIATPDQDAMMIAVTSREYGTMSLNRQVGARLPLLMSSLGRAYLAFCSQEEIAAVLDRLRMSTNPFDAPAKNRSKIMEMLDETRARGYAVPDPKYVAQVYQNQVNGFSAPLIVDDRVIGAVNIMYHSATMTPEVAEATLLPQLLELAKDIGAAIASEGGSHTVYEARLPKVRELPAGAEAVTRRKAAPTRAGPGK